MKAAYKVIDRGYVPAKIKLICLEIMTRPEVSRQDFKEVMDYLFSNFLPFWTSPQARIQEYYFKHLKLYFHRNNGVVRPL